MGVLNIAAFRLKRHFGPKSADQLIMLWTNSLHTSYWNSFVKVFESLSLYVFNLPLIFHEIQSFLQFENIGKYLLSYK